jgi:hypothetical protein
MALRQPAPLARKAQTSATRYQRVKEYTWPPNIAMKLIGTPACRLVPRRQPVAPTAYRNVGQSNSTPAQPNSLNAPNTAPTQDTVPDRARDTACARRKLHLHSNS